MSAYLASPHEDEQAFMQHLAELAVDWRYSDDFIGKVVRSRWPARYRDDPGVILDSLREQLETSDAEHRPDTEAERRDRAETTRALSAGVKRSIARRKP